MKLEDTMGQLNYTDRKDTSTQMKSYTMGLLVQKAFTLHKSDPHHDYKLLQQNKRDRQVCMRYIYEEPIEVVFDVSAALEDLKKKMYDGGGHYDLMEDIDTMIKELMDLGYRMQGRPECFPESGQD